MQLAQRPLGWQKLEPSWQPVSGPYIDEPKQAFALPGLQLDPGGSC